jgi:hypothetical protein
MIRMQRKLMNLLDNAVEYEPEGGEVRRVSLKSDDHQTIIAVAFILTFFGGVIARRGHAPRPDRRCGGAEAVRALER